MGRRWGNYLEMFDVDGNGCWIYGGKRNRKGYGLAGSHGAAHRYFYEQLVAPIPAGLQIDHLCMNPGCVNPKHMEPVTVQENLRRKYEAMQPRTHCAAGHEFTPENTYVYPNGWRDCIECRRRNKRAFRSRRAVA